jgi:hypothetical protein
MQAPLRQDTEPGAELALTNHTTIGNSCLQVFALVDSQLTLATTSIS